MNAGRKTGSEPQTGSLKPGETLEKYDGADHPPEEKGALPLGEQAQELRRQIQTLDDRRDSYEKMLRGIIKNEDGPGDAAEE